MDVAIRQDLECVLLYDKRQENATWIKPLLYASPSVAGSFDFRFFLFEV